MSPLSYQHSLSVGETLIDTYHVPAQSTPLNQAVLSEADVVSHLQVSENAKQDLKDGLALYNSETNLGLRNAWNIIQAEVRAPIVMLKGLH